MNKDKNQTIKYCFKMCPFFRTDMDGMYCGHPHWDSQEAYSEFIITHKNSLDGNIPELCPLRTEKLTINTTYKLAILDDKSENS